jgi:hypothetical protein
VDIQLYLRVLWRFRLLVATGLIVAVALAALSFVRVSFAGGVLAPKVTYREQEQWVSYSTLFVTQPGFPWGYSIIRQPDTPEQVTARAKDLAPEFADPNRFASLAVLYSYLATSDPVRTIIRRDGPLRGKIQATPVVNLESGYGVTLPLIRISGISTTPPLARRLNQRATDAFRQFLADQQQASHIPRDNRVLVTVVKRAETPVLFQGRSVTLPAVVFMAVAIAVAGLALLLENLRPRTRPTPSAGEDPLATEPASIAAARKTA